MTPRPRPHAGSPWTCAGHPGCVMCVPDWPPGSVVKPAQEGPLTGLQDVGGFQRDPETLKTRRLSLTVMVFLALPPLRHLAVKAELKEMTALDLPAVRADVVLALTQRPDDPELVQPRLLACLPQHSISRRLTRPDTPGRDLDADFLIGVIHMPEHQQPPITDD